MEKIILDRGLTANKEGLNHLTNTFQSLKEKIQLQIRAFQNLELLMSFGKELTTKVIQNAMCFI